MVVWRLDVFLLPLSPPGYDFRVSFYRTLSGLSGRL